MRALVIDHSPLFPRQLVFTARLIAIGTGRVFKASPETQTLHPALDVGGSAFSLVAAVECMT